MTTTYASLFGELISIARIADGNTHLITPETTAFLRHCLDQIAAGTAQLEPLCRSAQAQKRKMVPDCFSCANPCGKTFPFDLLDLPEGECGSLKRQILEALCRSMVEEALLYQCLTVVGLDGYEATELTELLQKIG